MHVISGNQDYSTCLHNMFSVVLDDILPQRERCFEALRSGHVVMSSCERRLSFDCRPCSKAGGLHNKAPLPMAKLGR